MKLLAALLALTLASPALAQNQPMFATGTLTPGHAVVLQQTGTPGSAVTRDAGPALAGAFTEIGITNDGLPLCVRDKLMQHIVCLGANALGGGLLSYNPIGNAPPLSFSFVINGSKLPFPGPGTGNVLAPDSPAPTPGNVAIWNGGTTLRDGGLAAAVVPDNARLITSPVASYPNGLYRLDFAVGRGAPPQFYKPETGTCAAQVPPRVADNGSCVNTSDGNSYYAVFDASNMDVRQWGAAPDNGATDAGPPIRAATAYCASIKGTLLFVPGTYVLNTLDPSGLGAIVFGTGATGPYAQTCNYSGSSSYAHPEESDQQVMLTLGNGLNRPLLYAHQNTTNPKFEDMTFNGNRGNQSGWSGGPGGKLYTIQFEDHPTFAHESSGRFYRCIVREGFNGDLYLGSNRGQLFTEDTWFLYSGQNNTDYAIFLNGFDTNFRNLLVGVNAGNGMLVNEGTQYQFTDGAFFLNGAAGMVIVAGPTTYLDVKGVNFQQQGTNGLQVIGSVPFAGQQAGILSFSDITFDNNSRSATGTYSDVLVDNTNLVRMSNIGFFGGAIAPPAGTIPKYNIELLNSAKVQLFGVSFGTGQSSTLGLTNSFPLLSGVYNVTAPWSPQLLGTTSGTTQPTYAIPPPFGTWSRNGNRIVATYNIQTTSLAGLTGNLYIGNLPIFSTTTPNDFGGGIPFNIAGWTSAAGASMLQLLVNPSSNSIGITEAGSGHSSTQVPVTDFAAATTLIGVVTYDVDP